MVGRYYQDPEAMLTHAIAVTLTLAAMFSTPNRRVLATICSSDSMLQRAAKRIYHHVIKQMAADYEPTREDLTRLVQEVLSIAKES